MRVARCWVGAFAVFMLFLAGCGGDDDSANDEPSSAGDADAADPADDESDGGGDDSATSPAGPSGDAGAVVLGGETISFDSARCFLEEQDAAAGGGKILFVAQGFGTNADDVEVSIDVSRFDEDSQFTGDKINVVVGDPFSADAVSWDANIAMGGVERDGSTLRASGLTFVDSDGGSQPGSFELHC